MFSQAVLNRTGTSRLAHKAPYLMSCLEEYKHGIQSHISTGIRTDPDKQGYRSPPKQYQDTHRPMQEIICHDCKKTLKENEEYHDYKNGFFKCKACHQKDSTLRNFQKTEVYSRIVGYIRPVSQWNRGKQEEFKDRKCFKAQVSQ